MNSASSTPTAMTLSTRSRVEGLADANPDTPMGKVEGLAAIAILVNQCNVGIPLKNIVSNSVVNVFPSMVVVALLLR